MTFSVSTQRPRGRTAKEGRNGVDRGLIISVCTRGLLALRTIAQAYAGLAAVAADAGINREALRRGLSPKGNPTLRNPPAVMKALGMRLSVEADPREAA